MVIVISALCDSFTIYSSNLVPTNQLVSLVVILPSGDKKDINVPVSSSSIVVDAALLGLSELPTGIYSLDLVVVDNDDVVKTERRCLYLDCDVDCKKFDALSKRDLERFYTYEMLSNVHRCEFCSCDELRVILSKLEEVANGQCKCPGCGCM